MTLPDLTPEDPEATDAAGRRARMVEGALMALIVVLAAGVGAPELVQSVRDGSIDLGTVFYPVMLTAIAALAWTRRAGQ